MFSFSPRWHDLAVQLAQSLVVGHRALAHEELVVADGLHLEIVVEFRDFLQRLVALSRQHGAEQLAGFAGAAHDQSLAIALDDAARQARRAVKVVQMALADDAVEVGDARLRGGQQDDVVGLLARVDGEAGVDLPEHGDVFQALQLREHLHQHHGRGPRIVHGAVGVGQRNAHQLAQRAQLVVLEPRIQIARKGQRVQGGKVELPPDQRERAPEEGHVELGVVRHQHRALTELREVGHGLLQRPLAAQHAGRDARDLHDLLRQRPAGIDELGELGHLHAVFKAHRADFDDLVGVGVQPRGLHVQHHEGRAVEGLVRRALDDVRRVLDEIALAAGDELDSRLLGRAEGLGEGLHHAVVGDGHGPVAPRRRLLDEVGGRGAGVHGGEGGVQMQLHALFRRGIPAHGLFGLHDVVDHQHHLALEVVVAIAAAGGDPLAVLQRRRQRVGLRLNALRVLAAAPAAQKQLAVDRTEGIAYQERHDLRLAVLGVAHVQPGDLAAHGAAPHVLGQLVHGQHRVVDGLAVNRVHRRGLLSAAGGLRGLGRVHGQRLGLPGAGGGDLADAPLVVAGELNAHGAADVEQLGHQLFQHAVHAAGLQIVHALGGGHADGQLLAVQTPSAALPVDERHGAGALVANLLLHQPRGHGQVRAHRVAQREIAHPRLHAHHRKGRGHARRDELVLVPAQNPRRLKGHAHVARLFRNRHPRQRQALQKRAVVGLDQLFPSLTHVLLLAKRGSRVLCAFPARVKFGSSIRSAGRADSPRRRTSSHSA